MRKSKKKNNNSAFWISVLIVVIAILFIAFYDSSKKDQEKKKTLQDRLKELNNLRSQYNEHIQQSHKKETRVYLYARSIVALFILIINVVFCYFFLMGEGFKEVLSNLVNLNESFILFYTFLAFTSYGTATKFVEAFRRFVFQWHKRKNLIAYMDIEYLEKEIAGLEIQIEAEKSNPHNEQKEI